MINIAIPLKMYIFTSFSSSLLLLFAIVLQLLLIVSTHDTINNNNDYNNNNNEHMNIQYAGEQQQKRQQQQLPQCSKLPHIIMFIMDDLGSNDLGIHGNSNIYTPYCDELASTGLYLSNYYVLPYCSPTRAAILSGRYPLHTGLHNIISDISTASLPLDEETLPSILRTVGYKTHAVGKWHVGHAKWEYTPTYRGFQSFFGYYLGRGDYYTHRKGSDFMDDEGYDMHYDQHEYCGANCSIYIDERGNYSTHLFTREAIRIIKEHATKTTSTNNNNEPLFLYVAHQAVHEPNEVPNEYLKLYENYTSWSTQKKIYAGMLSVADESLGNITKVLQDTGLWNDTIIIFTTDNGGPTSVCGIQGSSNGIKRGGKCTIWEGGTTGDAFISGPAFWERIQQRRDTTTASTTTKQHQESKQQQQRQEQSNSNQIQYEASSSSDNEDHSNNNTTTTVNYNHTKTVNKLNLLYPYLFHAVDWLPTLSALVNAKPNGKKQLDGVNQLNAMKYISSIHNNNYNKETIINSNNVDPETKMIPPQPREELFIGYANIGSNWYGPAIRYKNWKLIQGKSGGPETINDHPIGPNQPAYGGNVSDTYLLFHIINDPTESYNLVDQYPNIVQLLQKKLQLYQQHYVPPLQHDTTCDPFRGLINTTEYGPTWVPWCSKVIVYS